MEWWLIYLLLGAVVGFFAGLLGIGGGLIVVPALTLLFTLQDFPPDRVTHLALGTTLATIIFTAMVSLYTHHRHGAINWQAFRYMTPGIITGTLGGALWVGVLSGVILRIIFVCFLLYTATSMLFRLRSKLRAKAKRREHNGPVAHSSTTRTLPGIPGLVAAGGIIGALSSLVAIGGGTLSVPFLTRYNVKLQHAIGTAAALGLPIALTGAAGYMYTGITQAHAMPEYSLGHVYLPALFWLALASMLTTPLGARTTHTISTTALHKVFIGLLYLIALTMLASLLP